MSFSYTDGSNNSFHISPENLKYEPIQPEFSNTGFYSGGEPQQLALSDDQYQHLLKLAKAALEDKGSHLKNRPKGSGTLSMNGKRIVLAMSSESKQALESALRDLLN
jgi:hypothetical protein